MVQEAADAASRVRAIFETVVAAGFRAETVVGATDEEIDRMAVTQGVGAVPAALREVLRLLGREPAVWFAGSFFGVRFADASMKQDALDCLDEVDDLSVRDPQGLLAVLDAAGSAYLVVDGADLELPDPPLWVFAESGTATKRWESVTKWFTHVGEEILEEKAMLVAQREQGRPDLVLEAYFILSPG